MRNYEFWSSTYNHLISSDNHTLDDGWRFREWSPAVPGMICDHPRGGGWPYCGRQMTILLKLGDHPLGGGWPAWVVWVTCMGVTMLGMVGDTGAEGRCTFEAALSSLGWWVTSLRIMDEHISDDGWPCLVTMLRMAVVFLKLGNHPLDGGWPPAMVRPT